MKKKKLVFLLVIISILGIFIFQLRKSSEIKLGEEPTFWVVSDVHLIANSLHDDGEEFQRIKQTSAGKELDYQEESIHALVDSAIKEKISGLIITGDLTLNGEKKSAEKLAELLAPLEENGIMSLVIPGNHDIHDGWARKFEKDNAMVTEQISPKAFQMIFSSSYKVADGKDKESLSYAVEVNPSLKFLMLDTNIYGKLPGTTVSKTNGILKPETLAWIEIQLKAGKEKNQRSVVFMHHNLYQHNDLINKGYVLDNAKELELLLKGYDVPLVFSGHTHAQSIKSNETTSLVEIMTASYAITEQTYGEVTFGKDAITYQSKSVDVTAWSKGKGLTETPLTNYNEYTKELFLADSRRMAYGQLIENGLYEDDVLDENAYFVGELNWAYFTGNNDYQASDIEAIKKEKGYQLLQEESPFLLEYVDSLLKESVINNREVTIPLK